MEHILPPHLKRSQTSHPIQLYLDSSIIQCYNNLTKSETKVADFVLHNRHRIHALSISELAAACDVSEATVSRFCPPTESTP